MATAGGIFYLQSGTWRWRVDSSRHEAALDLVDTGNPANKMRAPLPFSWRLLPATELAALARRPEIRLWMDPDGVLWRVSAVGPGTHYEYPLTRRHLVFDSQRHWSGIVAFQPPQELGDLTAYELAALRDEISDFGGRRRRFRAADV